MDDRIERSGWQAYAFGRAAAARGSAAASPRIATIAAVRPISTGVRVAAPCFENITSRARRVPAKLNPDAIRTALLRKRQGRNPSATRPAPYGRLARGGRRRASTAVDWGLRSGRRHGAATRSLLVALRKNRHGGNEGGRRENGKFPAQAVHDKRRRPLPAANELDKLRHVLFVRRDHALDRIGDVVHLQPEMGRRLDTVGAKLRASSRKSVTTCVGSGSRRPSRSGARANKLGSWFCVGQLVKPLDKSLFRDIRGPARLDSA